MDNICLGSIKNNGTFIFKQVEAPQKIKIETDSEFGRNEIYLHLQPNTNYFVRQMWRSGVFVTQMYLKEISQDKGKRVVSNLDMLELYQDCK